MLLDVAQIFSERTKKQSSLTFIMLAHQQFSKGNDVCWGFAKTKTQVDITRVLHYNRLT